jgi:hypothetical protein
MQRLASTDGIVEIIAGAGGRTLYPLDSDPRLLFANSSTFGALRLKLSRGLARFASIAADGTILDSGQVGYLNGGQRLDVDLGMALFEAADQVGVVGEPQPGVEPAHNVELADWRVPGERRLVERLLERHQVRALLLRLAREGGHRLVGRADYLFFTSCLSRESSRSSCIIFNSRPTTAS